MAKDERIEIIMKSGDDFSIRLVLVSKTCDQKPFRLSALGANPSVMMRVVLDNAVADFTIVPICRKVDDTTGIAALGTFNRERPNELIGIPQPISKDFPDIATARTRQSEAVETNIRRKPGVCRFDQVMFKWV